MLIHWNQHTHTSILSGKEVQSTVVFYQVGENQPTLLKIEQSVAGTRFSLNWPGLDLTWDVKYLRLIHNLVPSLNSR